MNIEELIDREESQTFDRKSVKISNAKLANILCALANSDGGTIAIGISDKTKTIEGLKDHQSRVNEFYRVPFDYCNPSIICHFEKVACFDSNNQENYVLTIQVETSTQVHANLQDEVYMRIGDQSKKLSFEDRVQLMYDKGLRYYEDSPVIEATIDDIDLMFVKSYLNQIGYKKDPIAYLKENKGFIKSRKDIDQISVAAILLFGKNPQEFFPRARLRFIKYQGNQERFGTRMNVIKDIIFEGNILKQLEDCLAYIDTQIKEPTFLGFDGRFVTMEEYPKFVRQEIIVNALTHRDYSIKGTDIHIKMFDDKIVVESPGRLPGLVKTSNIHYTHFSRNPKIAEFLKSYEYVKEFGEGVNRMAKELEACNLPALEFVINSFMLHCIVRNGYINQNQVQEDENYYQYLKTVAGNKIG